MIICVYLAILPLVPELLLMLLVSSSPPSPLGSVGSLEVHRPNPEDLLAPAALIPL